MKNKWLAAFLSVFLGLFMLSACAEDNDSNSDASAEAAASQTAAPELSGEDILTGDTVKLSDYEGKVVILNFWATWCGPCKMEIPDMIDLREDYGDDLEIFGVALDDMPADYVADIAGDFGINYPVIMGTEAMSSAYGGIMSIPTTFVIDREGMLIGKAIGARSYDQFYSMVSPYF